MDCKKVQRMWHDLADGRLPAETAAALQRHVAECSDCRVARQRADKLQQLFTIKRHERPPEAYFANFVADFHQRLEAEEAKATWLQRVLEPVTFDTPAWRYGLSAAAAASVLVAAGLYWDWTEREQIVVNRSLPAATQMVATTSNEPVMALISSPAEQPPLASGVVLAPAAPNAATPPRYVLDRITITPASYEPGSVRF